MKGIVLMPFQAQSTLYQAGQVVVIDDWGWVERGLVRPIGFERPAPEMAVMKPQERTVLVKRGRHAIKA